MILSKAEYISSINALLPDNATQEISPLDIRTSFINLIDSVGNFLIDSNINSLNFSTPNVRTTKAGDYALSNISLPGRSSIDNSAFGYGSLRGNYNGNSNTAIGAYALACNLYGSSNIALGVQALAGNISGSGNVSLGNYTLLNNKRGHYNIAIGHGAGYYVGPEEHYTLSIGSIPSSSINVCDASGNPVYEGLSPLIFGNLQQGQHKLGIGFKSLHNYGVLQVSGDISPAMSGSFSLGKSQFPWNSINDFVYFSGSNLGIGGVPSGSSQGLYDAKLTVYGDIVPSQKDRYAIGNPSLTWDGYFNDVIISGQLLANNMQYNTISQCLYECKTLHLATSGFCDPEDIGFHNSSVCGFLNDESLDGAGFEIHSSGNSYQRDYRWIYKSPDSTVSCLETDNAFSRSRWMSNISIQIENGRHLQTDRIISNNSSNRLSIVHQSGCMGMFIEPVSVSGQKITFAQEPHISNSYHGLKDINFISRSGTTIINNEPSGYNYGVTYGSIDSGVKIMQRFLTRIKNSNTVRGFSIIYHDEKDSETYQNCNFN